MVPELRREKILNSIQNRNVSYIKDIAAELDISLSTVRRDVAALEQAGSVVVIRGGAVKFKPTAFDQTVATKRTLHSREKDIIARRAAALVEEGDVIYVDSGTTTAAMFKYLGGKRITVVTSSTELFDYLPMNDVKLIMLGGNISEDLQSVSGPFTEKMLADMHFTKAFIGGNSYTPNGSLYTHTENESRKKILVKEHSDRVYVLADTSKKNKYAFIKVFSLEGTQLITEE